VTEALPKTTVYINYKIDQVDNINVKIHFVNEPTNTRIKRLNSVNKAKKSSSRYDSQKFNQRMSTVMEIGAMLLMILAMVL